MHIVIPMSGVGKRFQEAGYADPKPLVPVDGRPVIEHVVGLFPGESRFTFVCNREHLDSTRMRDVLERAAPGCDIVPIEPHRKGPVYAVSLAFDRIDDREEVIVNYCDFSKYWDYRDFLAHTRGRGADGAISAYRGFHPHMLGPTQYAFLRQEHQWMLEIREKEPFTQDRMSEYASDGTYYFRKGEYVKRYFRRLMERGIHLNGEYYVSLVYNLLREDGLKVSVYGIQHMLQWGAPKDLREYQRWSDYFRRAAEPRRCPAAEPGSLNLVPLAGRGRRFAEEGYATPKPLLEVGGKPMILQAANCLPSAERYAFVCLKEHLAAFPLAQAIRDGFPGARIVSLDRVTEGQACTCETGLAGEEPESPLLIGACDNGMTWDPETYEGLLRDETVDAIVWTFRRHPSSEQNPQMYGWVRVDAGNSVLGVSVKRAISTDPFHDHAIVGTFYFRKARYFLDALQALYRGNIRVNGEYYVDSCVGELVAAGRRVKAFEVTDYVCWGTPDDLRTYEYWQSFFHKCPWHPYRLERDPSMDPANAAAYDRRFRTFRQEHR